MMRRTKTTAYNNQCYCGSFEKALIQPKTQVNNTARPKILFFFMERFTNSRSWQSAMKLAALNELFDAQNIVTILVGDFKHLLPATRLAAEMDLPFLLLGDHNETLWRRYGQGEFNTIERRDSYVLVDLCGRVKYSAQDHQPELDLGADQLFNAINRVH